VQERHLAGIAPFAEIEICCGVGIEEVVAYQRQIGVGGEAVEGEAAAPAAVEPIEHRGNLGVAVVTNGAKAIANVMIKGATLSGNLVGLRATGPKATVRIGSSDISGNATSVAGVSGGILQSYGNNQLNGNNTDGTMTTIATH
jgi:hypothetical protein